MRFFQQLAPVVAFAAVSVLADGALVAQAPEVTGALTIDKAVHSLTHVYAFGRKNGAGEDQGLMILFTSVPVPVEAIRGYMNNSWWQTRALKGELTALEVIILPFMMADARSAAGARNCCQSNFYAKGLITEDLSLSISGTQQVSLTKAEAGRVAGRLQLPLTKNSPQVGGGATLQYDFTFNTKLLTQKVAYGPWGPLGAPPVN